MGMDAAVDFWYGVTLGGDDYTTVERLQEESERRTSVEPYEWLEDGCTFQFITPSEGSDPVGFGVVLLYHDWDFEPKAWEDVVAKVADELARVKPTADRVLEQLQAPALRGVYMHTKVLVIINLSVAFLCGVLAMGLLVRWVGVPARHCWNCRRRARTVDLSDSRLHRPPR